MLKKFANGEMSQNEVDNMMEDFFEKKGASEFKEKWNKKLDSGQTKSIPFFRKHVFATVSAASIVLLIGISSIFFYKNNGLTGFIKGKNAKTTELNEFVSKHNFNLNSDASRETKMVLEMYNTGQFSKVMDNADMLLSKDNAKLNEMFFLAGMAAVKEKNFPKAKKYLINIDENSPYFDDSQKMLDLIEDILD